MLSSKEIRQQFIDFFIGKNHKAVPSAPVIPIDDPTLLFTNAGMNQFKDIFLGKVKPEFLRVVNSQKCIRAGGKHNDLEEVGRDSYHHTFFEMLGNWSFGDYYKKEAITWAWELLTDVWKIPRIKLYATVHDTDKEAFELWKSETDIKLSHIQYHGDKDNFWEMGDTGPCGPCSEIHFDRGKKYCNLKDDPEHTCKINGDCHRYFELWNLVFIQFNRDEKGKRTPLTKKFVDTGAGFERIVQVLQNKDSNYHTDLFMPIIKEIAKISGKEYHTDEHGTSHRIIADHIRALSFAISDGEIPSNEGRGYVLRRILRRAAFHCRLLDIKEPVLFELVDVVADILGDYFTELHERIIHTKLIIKIEEKRFNLTLDNGITKFNEIIAKIKSQEKVGGIGKVIPGKYAFTLYDTYGFPLDLTRIMAEEVDFLVDEKGFNIEMGKQKKRAREAAKFEVDDNENEWMKNQSATKTKFVGYFNKSEVAEIQNFYLDDEKNVVMVLDKTPFYAESGGQVADIGRIYNDNFEVKVTDVQKENDVYFHFGRLMKGEINYGKVSAEVEEEHRKNIARNHTATHLLHKALREVLGEHVHQKGSLVHPEHLRFDFTHFQKVAKRELDMVEKIVNRKIRECIPLEIEIRDIEEAKKEGAVALFGEKYGDKVRVVSINNYSKELCGGTHLDYTGEIGFFKITSESSIAAGIRRIEAITGERAERYVKLLENEIDEIVLQLNTPKSSVLEKLEKILSENKHLNIQIRKIKVKSTGSALDRLVQQAVVINGVKVVIARVKTSNPEEMRQMGDQLKNKLKTGIGVLIANIADKVVILTIVTKDLLSRDSKYHAGRIAGEIAEIVGGRGGGRPDMAMAGGKDVSKIDEALKKVPEIINTL